MAFKLGSLYVTLGLKDEEFRKKIEHTEASVNSLKGAVRGLGSVIGVALGVEAVRQMVLMADSLASLETRVKRLTSSQAEYNRTMAHLVRISDEVGTSIADSVRMFQRFSITKETLNATGDQVMALTESVQKLAFIAGATTAEASGAFIQFSQALAAGELRGEELNSVLEQMPILARIIERELGILPGTIKQAAEQGQVLSDKVMMAVLKNAEDINAEFMKIRRSIPQAATGLANAMQVAAREIDKMSGATESIVKLMDELAATIRDDLPQGAANVIKLFDVFIDQIDYITRQFQSSGESLIDWNAALLAARDTLSMIADAVVDLPLNLRGVFIILMGEADQLLVKMRAVFEGMALNFFDRVGEMKGAITLFAMEFRNVLYDAINSVTQYLADKLEQTARGFDVLGATDTAAQLRTVVDALRASRNERNRSAEESYQQFRQEFDNFRNEISERRRLVEETKNAQLKASQDAINAELQNIERLKKEFRAAADERRRLTEGGDATPLDFSDFSNIRGRPSTSGQGKAGKKASKEVDPELQMLQLRASAFDDTYARIELSTRSHMDRLAEMTHLDADERQELLEGILKREEELKLQHDEKMLNAERDRINAIAEEKKRAQEQELEAVSNMATAVGTLLNAMAVDQDSTLGKIASGFKTFATTMISISQGIAAAKALSSSNSVPEMLANLGAVTAMFANIIGSVKGGRRHGGNMSGGGMYRINEGPSPEVIEQGGRQYAVPSKKGAKVIPMEQTSQGGTAIRVEMVNQTGLGNLAISNAELTPDGVRVIIKKEIEANNARIASSLQSGRDMFGKAQESGNQMRRRVR